MKLRSIFFFCILSLVLGACFSPLGYEEKETGKIIISFGSKTQGAREKAVNSDGQTHRIMASTISKETLRYELKFTSPSGKTLDKTAVWGQTVSVELAPGHWQVDVNAYLDKELHATGSEQVEVKAGQDNYVEVTMSWNMNVVEITVESGPTKTTYHVGEPLNLTGLTVKADYNDGSSGYVAITMENIIDYDSSTAGSKTVTVSYGGKTATFTVTVDATELTGISIITPPAKTDYYTGDASLDLTGMIVEASYSSGSPVTIAHAELEISGFNSSAVGTVMITVTYGQASDTFNITIHYPAIGGAPVITSDAAGYYKYHQGATLSVNTSGVTGSVGTPTAYKWYRSGISPTQIGTAGTYPVAAADRNENIYVVV
ncbi:MAG: bacterial Ig-like domain-containing protein, partial [Spirochaetaceae bacterium]|nr:bacterial Ig-like domain-containing protein [Spirochaetaceae bacterium]